MPAVFFVQQSRPDWSWRPDLNPQRAAYNATALPTELRQRVAGLSRLSGKQVRYVLFYIGEKRNQCVFGAKRVPCPLRSPFGRYQYNTHFRKNRLIFFSCFSNAVQQDRKMTKCRAFSSVYLRFFQVQFFTEPLCCIFFVSDVKSVKHMPFAV